MAKSFCAGCVHWQRIDDGMGFRFMACLRLHIFELDLRKKMCNGKLKQTKED